VTLAALSLREQRLIALAILVALVALVLRGIVVPVADGFAARAAERDALALQVARNARLVDSMPRLSRIALAQRQDLRLFLLSAPTEEAGGQLLLERVQASLEAVGGEYLAGDALPGGPDLVRVRVDARVSEAEMQRLFADLQNRPPYLSVDGFAVSSEDPLVTGDPEALSLRVDLSVPFVRAARR
jgi:hypothetical protein